MNAVLPNANSQIPVVCVVGPTGSGKSHLALRIARELNGEIVNCDSLQVYRGFDIGTAKPSRQEQASVPHHLIDVAGLFGLSGAGESGVAEPAVGEFSAGEFSAGEFARRARQLIPEIHGRGRLPVVAGGTGFYLKALIDGLVEGPQRDEEVRERLLRVERRHEGNLHRILRRWDPAAALRIHASDVQKLVRALELILLEREPLSRVYERHAGRERVPRASNRPGSAEVALYARLDARSNAMWEGGLIEETRALLARGCRGRRSPSARSVINRRWP